jgi:hypothetical protein
VVVAEVELLPVAEAVVAALQVAVVAVEDTNTALGNHCSIGPGFAEDTFVYSGPAVVVDMLAVYFVVGVELGSLLVEGEDIVDKIYPELNLALSLAVLLE